jgi:hypothetical protein
MTQFKLQISHVDLAVELYKFIHEIPDSNPASDRKLYSAIIYIHFTTSDQHKYVCFSESSGLFHA